MLRRPQIFPELLSSGQYDTVRSNPTDRRIASWMTGNDALLSGGVAVIGFPTHIGVVRNGGRPGAAHGPGAIRRAFGRLTPDAVNPGIFCSVLEKSIDLGDIRVPLEPEFPEEDVLLLMQRRLGRVVERVLGEGGVPVILGGGHETAFGHYLGSIEAFQNVTLLNWDAHPDVRELKEGRGHSGSPFRQAIEVNPSAPPRYIVAGLLGHCVSQDHLDFVRSHGEALFRSDIDVARVRGIYDSLQGPTQVSFDMDAVSGSEAPGVSAPSIGGFSSMEWLEIARLAGATGDVKSVDIVELNPTFDIDQKTARLAALTLWHFIRGLAQRGDN